MHNFEEKIQKKIKEVRGKRSYAKMAKEYAGECEISDALIWKYEHGKLQLPLDFLIAMAEQENLSLDELILERNLPLVQQFNHQHELIARDAELLERFEDACWVLADAAREAMNGSNLFHDDFDTEGETLSIYAKRFQEVRTFAGKSVDEVAKLMGCNRSKIYRNENVEKATPPKIHYLLDFCTCMEASADYVVFGEFRGMRNHTGTILVGLPYHTQLALLAEFVKISKNFLP